MGVGDMIRSKIAGNPVVFMMEKYTLVVMEVVKIPEIRSFNMMKVNKRVDYLMRIGQKVNKRVNYLMRNGQKHPKIRHFR
jgi:hypothetical protein